LFCGRNIAYTFFLKSRRFGWKARKKKGSKERKHKEGKKSRKDLVKLIRPGE